MEKSVNKVELSGFAGKNPELLTLKNGKQMIRFSLATSNSYKNAKQEWVRDTTWHNVVMWDKVAEDGIKKISKGSFVSLSGRIVNKQYTDKKGVKQNVFEIIAVDFTVVAVAKKEEKEAIA
ncbi:MAG: single-stranded DNA-binding protein [Bacteroidota bacterium]